MGDTLAVTDVNDYTEHLATLTGPAGYATGVDYPDWTLTDDTVPAGGGFPALTGGASANPSPSSQNVALAAPITQYVIPTGPGTVMWDSGGVVDQANNRLIVPADGLYLVNFNPQVASTSLPSQFTVYCYCYNASNVVQSSQSFPFTLRAVTGLGTDQFYQYVTMIFPARATNYFNLQGQRTYQGAATDYAGVNQFSITKIAPHP